MANGVWQFRGTLPESWAERREATGLTMDAVMMLGIQTAEARMVAQPTGKKRSVETAGGEMVEHGHK